MQGQLRRLYDRICHGVSSLIPHTYADHAYTFHRLGFVGCGMNRSDVAYPRTSGRFSTAGWCVSQVCPQTVRIVKCTAAVLNNIPKGEARKCHRPEAPIEG